MKFDVVDHRIQLYLLFMFNSIELQELINHGLTEPEVKRQMDLLKNGVQSLEILEPATVNNGIIATDEQKFSEWLLFFENRSKQLNIIKFIPASGAATRMFLDLKQFQETGKSNSQIDLFFDNRDHFCFLKNHISKLNQKDKNFLIEFVLSDSGLNLANLPKALIEFHEYLNEPCTPMLSHSLEAKDYAKNSVGETQLHFTFSDSHLKFAKNEIEKINQIFKNLNEEIKIELSVQDSSTDTIVLDQNDCLLKDKNGHLVFRPGGHGSLIKNLNRLQNDLIFIRNIDNVVQPENNSLNIYFEKVLAGCLLSFRSELIQIINNNLDFENLFQSLSDFSKQYQIHIDNHFSSREELLQFFNRPIRVCAMVKNNGQPGGGPFWVRNKKSAKCLQIVEASQFNSEQQLILQQATHFNPVDMVICPYDLNNNKFDLNLFIDHSTSFIATKSIENKLVSILERPGLWNGSMSDWLTIFLEVPADVFNPVKVVTDLLNPLHRKK